MHIETPAEAFERLVSKFKPSPLTTKNKEITTNPDTLIGTRIRPLSAEEIESGDVPGVFKRDEAKNVVDLHELRKVIRTSAAKIESSTFSLDRVYGPNDTTESVYEGLVAPLMPVAWGGGIGTLFAYGQTGSGKTFTVSGIEKIVATELFGGEFEGERRICVSIVELAGNLSYDLLNDRKPISILEDSFREVKFVGAIETEINAAADLISLIDKASTYRSTASTEKNDTSSRSHAICRIAMANPSTPSAPDGILYLVDLAGSEAARDRAHHSTDRIKETREINVSLSILKDCIRGRAQVDPLFFLSKGKNVKKSYIPFRQSNLTKALKHVFDPDVRRSCKTSVLACVNPSYLDGAVSKSTLRYAELLRVDMPKPGLVNPNKDVPSEWSNAEVKDWIKKNSGNPFIDAAILAPFESGIQLIRMSQPEFVQRCMKTPGVTEQQATAFYNKLWRQHIDNSKMSLTEPDPTVVKDASVVAPEVSAIPFKQRIKPGMVVQWKTNHETGTKVPMAVILCPDWALETSVKDIRGEEVTGVRNEGPRRYLCAMVSPALMPDAYSVSIWRQVVVDVKDMEKELLMEYDIMTRSYYLNV